jgi:hypothetical protein
MKSQRWTRLCSPAIEIHGKNLELQFHPSRERNGRPRIKFGFSGSGGSMDDNRIWSSEELLWTGAPQTYAATIDEECLMVLPTAPFIVAGRQAVEAVSQTPRWQSVLLTDRRVSRPHDGLIVIAYWARAERPDDQSYEAHCTTVYRRLEHDRWQVVQHQQTPPLVGSRTVSPG